ncbi:MAG TPA: beta-galactosidase [Lacipirellulaceae bacterium]|nr:beta-galactosidase [Lacipirellulaceae bacterium]HMP05485.1 beta-galactosidase [Lacipirellulaceae bacterium]
MESKWYETAYRRAVIDMHIPDWDSKFFSQFDPDAYADMLVKSRSESVVCYCQSHVGLFNYPTKVGQQHRGWHGVNMLQRMIDACHARGVAVQIYTSLVFDRWAGDKHPEWRIRTWNGQIQGEGGRHAVLCVNSPYREYVRSFVEEICRTFDFEGIRFDMTFWPSVCYCEHCQQRFAEEVGGELPRTVNWLDEKWVAFQRARERWLTEFAAIATQTVKTLKPAASVEHQSSTYPKNWMLGVAASLAAQNDFLQGDFYGDQRQGSFVRKLLERLSPNRPFGYETSFSVRLQDHTAMKSEALLTAKAASAIADSAAFVFIDAIDPIGTVNPRAHERMGQVFDRMMPYYQHLGGQRVRDVGVFYSFESKFDMNSNGMHVRQADAADLHTESTMRAASTIIGNQWPVGVITKESLEDLSDLKVLILSNVNMMDDEECRAIRDWVNGGGKLYASGGSSLVDKRGRKLPDFMLADVFGVSLAEADWAPRNHYIAPTAAGSRFFADFDEAYPAFCDGYGFHVTPHDGAEVWATTSLPWPRAERDRFSSIHSDPPWRATDSPEIVSHRFGQGRSIYCSSLIENLPILDETFLSLLRDLESSFQFEAGAPPCVEVTLFHQPERRRYRLALVNFQDQLPNIPVDDIEVRLRLPDRVNRIVTLPDEQPASFKAVDGHVVLQVPRFETLSMFSVEIG